ncbi:hypothetical protein PR048_007230 [Dryococelus australis]|uniref:CCHC-type domain-containing protein n=1 Tax=Dryococelus australis TaxID=614101 RepID=A0ABQ9ID21_9NEOP|nr:hypothetical protein PR048_007230 [Dryococelus australis]
MTRFARARGSKASNEKVPQEATPWRDMKRQLQESQVKQESSSALAKLSVRQLLQDDTADSKTEWALFEDKRSKRANTQVLKKKMKDSLSGSGDNELGKKNKLSKTIAGKVKKSKKLKVEKSNISKVLENDGSSVNANKEKKVCKVSNDLKINYSVQDNNTKQANPKKKKSTLKKDANVSSLSEDGIGVEKNRKSSWEDRNDGSAVGNKPQKKKKLSRDDKIESGQPYKRRKPLQKNMVMAVNGKEVPLAFFDGFVVKKEDAERLKDLQKKLTAKGIPKAEVKESMKLERRKAEKALARERKKVCFHCRNSGHLLSECPELASAEATGICYKCGSTEHKSTECRVDKYSLYKFAQCFVCSEQGHISSQCPNNSKGLYPKGGGCHICGEVTHFKRDCPRLEQQQESQNVTVGKISGGSLEALDGETKPKFVSKVKKEKKAKYIVF